VVVVGAVVVVVGAVVVVVGAVVVVVGAVVVVVGAVVVVVGAVVVVVASPPDSTGSLHPERTTRATNTNQRIQRMRHLLMLISPHNHCLPSVSRSQYDATATTHIEASLCQVNVCRARLGVPLVLCRGGS
jgi:hypothetical protein